MMGFESDRMPVWNDTYGITRIPTTVAGAQGCKESRASRQLKDRLPRFGPRGCVNPSPALVGVFLRVIELPN